MLLQAILTQRIIIALLAQGWVIIYSSYFAYKLLKRGKNRATYTLSSIFISLGLTFFLANLSIINTPFSYGFYISSIYLYFFAHSLIVIFTWVLIKLDDKTSIWRFYLVITFYGIISTYVFWIGFYFNGIMYNLSTNWIPTYSWFFLIISWTFLFILVIIPQIYLSFKLLKVFEGIILKRRINMFIVSIFLELIVVFSLFLYNTWVENQIYRTVYIAIFPLLSTIAAFLIYKSFGKELE